MANGNRPTGTTPPETTTRAPASVSVPPQSHAPASTGTPGYAPSVMGATIQPTPPPTPGNGIAAPGDVEQQLASQKKADDVVLSPEQSRDKVEATLTTGPMPAKPGTIATTPRSTGQTHLIVRTAGRPSFRRGGMTFTDEPTVIAVDSIGEDKASAIENEPMLEVKRISEDEAAHYQDDQSGFARHLATQNEAQLRQGLQRAKDENEQLRERVRALEEASQFDKAPKSGETFGEDNRRPRGR